MNLFRRPSVRYGQTPVPETPYQRATQVWDDRIGSARVQARNWRLIAFGNLVLASGLATGLVWQSARGTVVPWVVQVDKLGEAQAVAPAISDYKPADPQIAWHLARFIEQVRSVPADAVIVRQNWLGAYDFTTDKGAAALNDYARTNDPFAKVGKVQIAVEVSSVIRASDAPGSRQPRSDCLRGGAGTRIGPDYRARQAHRPDVGPLHVNGPRIRAVSSSEARDSIGSRLIASP